MPDSTPVVSSPVSNPVAPNPPAPMPASVPTMNLDAKIAFGISIVAALFPIVAPLLPAEVITDLHLVAGIVAALGTALHLDGK